MSKNYKWTYYIDEQSCMTCATCELECRDNAIKIRDYEMFVIDEEACTRCARCFRACPVEAVKRVPCEQVS